MYLYLLGCNFTDNKIKQDLFTKIKIEETFRSRLEKLQTKNGYKSSLAIINNEIDEMDNKRDSFNLNETLEQDLESLNFTKLKINRLSSQISKLQIHKSLIENSITELENNHSLIDIPQLEKLYQEASFNIPSLNKSFEDLVNYHNTMIIEKIKFLSSDLPNLIKRITACHEELDLLLAEEKSLLSRVSKGDSFSELEKLIAQINEKYRIKGEYERIISQITEVENNLAQLNSELDIIDKSIFSEEFKATLNAQIDKFNKHFSTISKELFDEVYCLKVDEIKNRNGGKLYKFSAFNANFGSGKKQGEILCFDLAYTLFADEENIPCLHFLLNYKKELMHNNQLIKVANFVKEKNLQLIVSILKDKTSDYVLNSANVALCLSPFDKLFRIK